MICKSWIVEKLGMSYTRIMKKTFTTAMAIVLGSSLPCVAEEAFSVSGLKADETLEVSYESQGCFHNSALQISITAGEVKMVEIIRKSDAEKKESKAVSTVELGKITLDAGSIAGLDRLLKFYADVPNSYCTTVDKITVEKKKGNETVRRAAYTDASCATYEMKGVVTFGQIERLIRGE